MAVEELLNNVEMGLTNDSPDIWIEGPEKQEKDFINLLTMNNDALTKARRIRTIKGRTNRFKIAR